MIYPDTSFLIPLYTDEADSENAHRFMLKVRAPLIYTPFHRLETRTALRGQVYRERLTLESLKRIFRQIDADLSDHILQHVALDWHDALREAEAVGEAHIPRMGARSGDLLHVACALVLGADEFCTFDQRQAVLAKRAGLKVKAWR